MNKDKKDNPENQNQDQSNEGSEKLNSLLQASLLHDAVLKKMLTQITIEPKNADVNKRNNQNKN
ncbi:MAG: hypothetical protein WCO63_14300 [Bacteroidota bacterium]